MVTLHDIQHLQFAGLRSDFATFAGCLADLGVYWPKDPAQGVLFDHGAAQHVRRLYGHIDLACVNWELRSLPASEITLAAVPWGEGYERIEEVIEQVDYWIGV